MDYLRVVLQVLKQNTIFAKYRKCVFWLRSVAFLGYIISREGVEVDPIKTEAVKIFPRPWTPSDIRSFFGLMGYYIRFVDDFASIASRMTTLTQKRVKFEWSEACERNFHILKDRLTFYSGVYFIGGY